MSTTKRLLVILAILFSCVGCDQVTKSVAKTYLSETRAVVLLGDTVRLQLAKRDGSCARAAELRSTSPAFGYGG